MTYDVHAICWLFVLWAISLRFAFFRQSKLAEKIEFRKQATSKHPASRAAGSCLGALLFRVGGAWFLGWSTFEILRELRVIA